MLNTLYGLLSNELKYSKRQNRCTLIQFTTHSHFPQYINRQSFVSFFSSVLFSGMNNSLLISSPFLISLSETPPHTHPESSAGEDGCYKIACYSCVRWSHCGSALSCHYLVRMIMRLNNGFRFWGSNCPCNSCGCVLTSISKRSRHPVKTFSCTIRRAPTRSDVNNILGCLTVQLKHNEA